MLSSKMVNTQKRKRDATLPLRMPASRSTSRLTPGAMIGESAAPLQHAGDDQSLALEQVLEKVAAGEGEEAGMKAEELSALSLRWINFLKEKNEIDKALATLNMSRMQAAHSSEQRKMVDVLEKRGKMIQALKRRNDLIISEMEEEKGEYLANEEESGTYILKMQAEQRDLEARNRYLLGETDYLKRENYMMSCTLYGKDMEQMQSARVIAQLQGECVTQRSETAKLQGECATLRSELAKLETEHQELLASSDACSDSDMLRTAFNGYLKASLAFSKYLHRKLAETPGRSDSIEMLEQLLKDFEICELARPAMIAQCKTNVSEHWISSTMFKGFENHLFGLDQVMHASTPVDAEQHAFECYIRAQEMAETSTTSISPFNSSVSRSILKFFHDGCYNSSQSHLTWIVMRMEDLKATGIIIPSLWLWPKKPGSFTN